MKRRLVLAVAMTTIVLGLVPRVALAVQRSSPQKALARLEELSTSFQALAEQVAPAVVEIVATGYLLSKEAALPGEAALVLRRVGGSGVIVDPDGYLVTNAHVVEGARRIQVRLPPRAGEGSPGRSILEPRGRLVGAQIVGVDRETDIAVLRVAEKGLPHLVLGDSDGLKKGQLVFAFGSPAGLENSVTMGVVSAVARQLRPEDPMIYIQTDAPINPGSSGGPLVDASGRVVGINTFILSRSGGSEGIGFAAPSNIVRNVFQQIRSTGQIHRGEIGVHAQTITPVLARGLRLPRDWGVVLGDVYPGSPAERAGLRVGDVILSLDGKVMENGRQFDVNFYRRPLGDIVTLEVLRGEERLTFRVFVLGRPEGLDQAVLQAVTPEENLLPELGVLAVDLDEAIARALPPLRFPRGVVVVARSQDAPYWDGGLLPGDVIHSVNGMPVTALRELRATAARLRPGDPIVLQLERRSRLMYLSFEIE